MCHMYVISSIVLNFIYRKILIFWVPILFNCIMECGTAVVRSSAVPKTETSYTFLLPGEQPEGIDGSGSVP